MKTRIHAKKTGILLIIALLFTSFGSFHAFAETNESRLQDTKNRQDEARIEKEQVDRKIEDITADLQKINDEMAALQATIQEKQTEILDLTEKINQKKSEIEDRQSGISARLRTMYKTSLVGYLDIILDSKDFTELMNNVSMVQRIYKADKDILEDLQDAQQAMEDDKKAVEQVQAELEEEKANLQTKENEKASVQAELEEHAAEIQAQIDTFNAQIQSLNEAIEEEQRQKAAQQSGGESSTEYYGGNGILMWPVDNPRTITSEFGYRPYIDGIPGSNYHNALDIAVPAGRPIHAAAAGYVMSQTGYYREGYGWGVFIDHGNGLATVYGHNSSIIVSPGQYVEQGQVIAYCGMTGWATGPHCHFEVRENGVCVNPRKYLG